MEAGDWIEATRELVGTFTEGPPDALALMTRSRAE